jgi:hypothetical protein
MRTNLQTERVGLYRVADLVSHAGWFFREMPPPDEGIDAFVEGQDSGRPNGRLIALQIKSGASYFREAPGGWRYRVAPAHQRYWHRFAAPVLIVLHDPERNLTVWQRYAPDALDQVEAIQTLFIPEAQHLDDDALRRWAAIADEGLPDLGPERAAAIRGRQAEVDVDVIEAVHAGRPVFLEAVQDVTSGNAGLGEVRLVSGEAPDSVTTVRSWPNGYLAGENYASELERIVPWADLSVDTKRYKEAATATFLQQCGRWDTEEKAYLFDDDVPAFAEWYAAQHVATLRPFATRNGGEIALWRLRLSLNETGRAALDAWRDEILGDAYEHIALQDEISEQRFGTYVGESVEKGPGIAGYFDVLAVEVNDDRIGLTYDEGLFNDTRRVASVLLAHAMNEPPQDAVVEAFCSAFRDLLDPDDGVLSIEGSDVQEWLDSLRLEFNF